MSIKFYMRKKIGVAKVNFRYHPNRKTDITLTTPFSINVEHWDPKNEKYSEIFKKRNPKNEIDKNNNKYIDEFNLRLNEFKISLNSFIISNNYQIDSNKLKNFISKNYSPDKVKNIQRSTQSSILISELIDNYIEEKSVLALGKHKPITQASIKKFNVIKNKLNKINPRLQVKEINDHFRDKFTKWSENEKYSEITIVKELKIIKTFIKYAKSKKHKVSDDVSEWIFYVTPKKYKYPTLNLTELKTIELVNLEHDYLDNARDWLLIGCYTGLRVSDLLNTNHTEILEDLLSFTQKKTKDEVTMILLPPIKKILEKRNGVFPRKISDQKFNDYIKKVCKKAGLTEIMIGGKMIDKRKVVGNYQKWELVSSHICRRSYVTIFRPYFGDEGVMLNTGHKTQAMVAIYDQNSELDKAKKMKNKILSIFDTLNID
ncbi:hypothetical protein DEU39_3492 [Chryseobacterium sp. AG363]|nr:hypothetical protein DEU39_3492 [Chryseobacterium sp. AG363]